MRPIPLLAAASLLTALACSDQSPTAPMAASKGLGNERVAVGDSANPPRSLVLPVESRWSKHVLQGTWGGDQAGLTISREGGTVQIFCAFGAIDQPVVADSNGRFDVAGTFTPMSGAFPVGGLPKYRARYSGTTDGRTMTLHIDVPDLRFSGGPFTLVHGVPSSLTPCMLP
jgi:hypothetical protein